MPLDDGAKFAGYTVCMQQTRRECRNGIREGNGLAPLP
jgi:hypothetical protein